VPPAPEERAALLACLRSCWGIEEEFIRIGDDTPFKGYVGR
jgi:hypothetical protein